MSGSLIQDMKKQGFRAGLLYVLYLGFMASFFFSTDFKFHNNYFYACLLGPYLLTLHRGPLKLFLRSPLFLLLLSLLVYLMMSPLWGDTGTVHDYGEAVIRCLSLMVFLMLTCELSLRYERFVPDVVDILCWAALIGGGLYIFVNHAQLFTINDAGITIPYTRFWLVDSPENLSVLRNAIHIGSVYAMVVLIMYFHFVGHGRMPEKLVYSVLSVPCLGVLFLTLSRGPLVAFYLAVIAGVLVDNNRKMILIFLCLTALGWYIINDSGSHNAFFFRGDSYRIEIFRAAMEQAHKAPLFGSGILTKFSYQLSDGKTLVSHPHNLYLSTLMSGGVMGLGLLIALLIRGVWQGIIYYMRRGSFMPGVWLIFGILSVFTGYGKIVNHPHPVYLYLWLPLGILMAHEIEERTGRTWGDQLSK